MASIQGGQIRVGIFPGTFDPVTLGHMDIMERALKVCDRLIVGVAMGHHKRPLFDVNERVALVQAALPEEIREQVIVKQFDGLLVNFARDEQADIVIRGIRVVTDFENEFQMALMNKRLLPQLETIFLMPGQDFVFVTSTLIREVAKCGGPTEGFVPENVTHALRNRYQK
jgi:pantetheine-phosphate adenylyltransferase